MDPKSKAEGLCIYGKKIKIIMCMDSAVSIRHCSANLEYLMVTCRPFYLSREFLAIVVSAVDIPLNANSKLAKEQYSKQQSVQADGAFISVGDFGFSSMSN